MRTPRSHGSHGIFSKIHKRCRNVLCRLVTSNSSYYTENIFSFLDYHFQSLKQVVKSYIKDTNNFLANLRTLSKLFDRIIMCTVDVVRLYTNIPQESKRKICLNKHFYWIRWFDIKGQYFWIWRKCSLTKTRSFFSCEICAPL